MRQKRGQGLPRIQIAPPLFGIFRRQQNLCRRQTLFGQRRLPALRQLNLSGRGCRFGFLPASIGCV